MWKCQTAVSCGLICWSIPLVPAIFPLPVLNTLSLFCRDWQRLRCATWRMWWWWWEKERRTGLLPAPRWTPTGGEGDKLDYCKTQLVFHVPLFIPCSSRSHLLFMLCVEGYNKVSKATSHGRLTLVDLAGSERISRSEATGIRLVEAAAINKSLSALGQV